MIYALIGFGLIMILLSILFRVVAVFRLTLPLLYALIAPTLFFDWFHANQPLAEGIGYGLIGLTVISWIFSFVKKVREWRDRRQDDKIAEELFLRRLAKAKAEGKDTVSTDGLYR